MSDYILAPGARLEIGPHGTPYEQMGACCDACGRGEKCGGSSSLGALSFTAWGYTIPTPVVLGVAALGAWWLFFRKKHRKNPARRRRHRKNPRTFTKKGERMYRHIKKGYGGAPRAKEIAARTVYSAAKRGVPGLVRKRRAR